MAIDPPSPRLPPSRSPLLRAKGGRRASPAPYADARQAYLDGMGLKRLRLRFHLSEGELRDVAPEEFTETPQPEGNIGGY